MKCIRFKDLMYLRDDELDADDAAALKEHMSSCAECAAEYTRVVSSRLVVGGIAKAPPVLRDPLLVTNAVMGRIEREATAGGTVARTPAFERFLVWLAVPAVRASVVAALLFIAGAFILESTSALVSMKSLEASLERSSAKDGATAHAGILDRNKVVNAAAGLLKRISSNQSYVEVSDKWVMINRESMEQLLLLYNELKETTPRLPDEFRTVNPELTRLLEAKQAPARMQLAPKEREQLIRELNRLLTNDRSMP